jgi:proteic killer suppression protein
MGGEDWRECCRRVRDRDARICRLTFNAWRYTLIQVIRSFGSKDTEKLAAGFRVRRFLRIERAAQRKLAMLAAATDVNDLSIPPSNHLEKLRGDRLGQYSIRINDQWRLCFEWQNGDARNVEITDYH